MTISCDWADSPAKGIVAAKAVPLSSAARSSQSQSSCDKCTCTYTCAYTYTFPTEVIFSYILHIGALGPGLPFAYLLSACLRGVMWCGGLVMLEGASAASVTIGSSAAAALLGIAVLLGFLASALGCNTQTYQMNPNDIK